MPTAVASLGAASGTPRGTALLPMLRPQQSVGDASSVPYGPTLGYATPNGVTGFIGPAAGSLLAPTVWYVRATGSNLNGGSSSGAAADRSGTDGSTTSGSLTFTSASAAFTVADIGKGICIQNATRCYAKIVAINSATSVQLSNPPSATAGSLSWAIGGAWATPEPVLNSNVYANTTCGVQSGDTVYIGAGTYRVVEAVGSNFGAAWNATGGTVLRAFAGFNGQASVVGDVTGQYTGDAGMVQLTAYTTNDKTAPSATTLLNLSGKSNLAFSGIMFVGGSSNLLTASTLTSQNISFLDCAFLSSNYNATTQAIVATCGYQVPFAWLIDRCYFVGFSGAEAIFFTGTNGAIGDYSVNVVFRNTMGIQAGSGGDWMTLTSSGAGSGHPGGLIVRSCFFFGPGRFLDAASTLSTVLPCLAIGNLIYCGVTTAALSAGNAGQMVENYNLIFAATPRNNVAIGANSVANAYAPLFHFGQERIWLPPIPRFFGEPMASSPLLGFGNDGAQTPYDLRGPLNPRPAGGASALPAVGALERADTFITDPSPIGGDLTPMKITGPGYNDLLLPISISEIGQARTVSIEVKYDAAYANTGGVYPTLLLVAKPQMGVTAQTVAAPSGSAGNVNTITLAAFTPTASGVLNLRLVSYDQSGTSVVEFDNMAIS